MVQARINNLGVWEGFLREAVQGRDYTALVHCTEEGPCREGIRSRRFEVIPSVKSSWCLDLVSPMNALLEAALLRGGTGSPTDKFVFLSESTLPIKPFGEVWGRLTADEASDFCIPARGDWATVPPQRQGAEPAMERVAVKHHQWIVLGRGHAEVSARRSGENMDLRRQLLLPLNPYGPYPSENRGCIDEFWHFTTIFGWQTVGAEDAELYLEDFNGGPLRTSSGEIQGRCDTFVDWWDSPGGGLDNFTSLDRELRADAGTAMERSGHKVAFRKLSAASLAALRRSPFLFMRKVEEGATFSGCEGLEEAFSALVFSTPARLLSATAEGRACGSA